jgi:tetratricopeptide (TPR) repeat protein
MEMDQLYKRLDHTPAKRFEKLKMHQDLVHSRDDLYLEQITLGNQLGLFQESYDLLMARKFHPWEGGEGKVTGQYVTSLTGMAKKSILQKNFGTAIELLSRALYYPENLGEGKLFGAQENAVYYWLGCAYEGVGNLEKATDCWQLASKGLAEPEPAVFYNDQQPDTIYYQGLAWIKLNDPEEARFRFNKLISFGQLHLHDEFRLDYFSVSLPDLQIWHDDLTLRNHQNCHYLISLGEMGLKKIEPFGYSKNEK